MKRLSGMDALCLYSETPQVHTHTLKVGVFDIAELGNDYSFEWFRNIAYPRLLGLEPLRYLLVDIPLKLHHPMWREDTNTDIDYHLRRVQVPAPGGRRQLDEVIGHIASIPLDREHPLWQMYVTEGLAGNRVAVIWKVHHALADGIASVNMIAKALASSDILLGEGLAARPEELPTRRALLEAALRDHLRQLAVLPKLLWDTVEGSARVWRRARHRQPDPRLKRPVTPPPSCFNHVVSPGRRFATAPLPLGEVKATSRALDVTINELVLSVAAGGLRQVLLQCDGRADSPLIAGVPVSFNKSVDRLSGNEFGYMTPLLPVHVGDRLERIRLTAHAAAMAKEDFALRGPMLMASWLGYLPPIIASTMFGWLSRRWSSGTVMNLTISNVPGPRQVTSIDGTTIRELYSVGPLAAGCAVNITVWSYADQLNISVLTDDATVSHPQAITKAMTEEFGEIHRALDALAAALTEIAAPQCGEDAGPANLK